MTLAQVAQAAGAPHRMAGRCGPRDPRRRRPTLRARQAGSLRRKIDRCHGARPKSSNCAGLMAGRDCCRVPTSLGRTLQCPWASLHVRRAAFQSGRLDLEARGPVGLGSARGSRLPLAKASITSARHEVPLCCQNGPTSPRAYGLRCSRHWLCILVGGTGLRTQARKSRLYTRISGCRIGSKLTGRRERESR
jgi:hypothetical protein